MCTVTSLTWGAGAMCAGAVLKLRKLLKLVCGRAAALEAAAGLAARRARRLMRASILSSLGCPSTAL